MQEKFSPGGNFFAGGGDKSTPHRAIDSTARAA
jgi:hypothetical protein